MITFLKLLAIVSGFPIWWHLGLLVAWLLGGADRDGELNAWGQLIMLPFLFVAWLFGLAVLATLILAPVLVIFFTPLCIFLFDNSCIESLRAFSW